MPVRVARRDRGRWQSSTPGDPMDRSTISRDWPQAGAGGRGPSPYAAALAQAHCCRLLAPGRPAADLRPAPARPQLESPSPSATTATSSRALPTRLRTRPSARSGAQQHESSARRTLRAASGEPRSHQSCRNGCSPSATASINSTRRRASCANGMSTGIVTLPGARCRLTAGGVRGSFRTRRPSMA